MDNSTFRDTYSHHAVHRQAVVSCRPMLGTDACVVHASMSQVRLTAEHVMKAIAAGRPETNALKA